MFSVAQLAASRPPSCSMLPACFLVGQTDSLRLPQIDATCQWRSAVRAETERGRMKLKNGRPEGVY